MRLEKLASPSALEFISAVIPSSLPKAAISTAVGAVAAAGAAILFIYNLYEHYEEKKHATELAFIENLYQTYLAKIAIHECNLIAGFPPIFQKNADGQCQTLAMTEAQVTSIAKNALRAPTDINLVTYRHHIICAIAGLKKYYFSHEEKTGLTIQVTLYLLNIIEKLLQFEGYAFDIAYLNALCDFICHYASPKGEKSAHFTCLNPVFRHLQYAAQKLIRHRETRSQEEMIAELRGTCTLYIDHSLRALTKFSIPYSDWHLVDCADPYLLRDGIYAESYVTRILGPTYWTHAQKILPTECELTKLISILATYYLQTIDSTRLPKIPLQSEIRIQFVDADILNNIHQIFEAHPDINPAKPLNHPHTQQILSVIMQFAKMIHSMISLLFFLNELSKMIKNLGASETDNPAHCRRLYALHQTLSDYIESQAELIDKQLREINRKNDHQMRIAEKECFLRDLLKMLKEIKVNIDTQSNAIRDRRKALDSKASNITDNETPREHMSEVANQIQAACNLTISVSAHTTPETSRPNSAASGQHLSPAIPTVIRQPSRNITLPQPPRNAPRVPTTRPNIRPAATNIPQQTSSNDNAVCHSYPKSYALIYENARSKSVHEHLQLLHLMLDIISDYTKNDSRFLRVLHGSFFHHHLEDGKAFVENLTEKMRALSDNSDDITRPLLIEQLTILTRVTQKPLNNHTGSFAMRVAFIADKCRKKGIILQHELPRLAVA